MERLCTVSVGNSANSGKNSEWINMLSEMGKKQARFMSIDSNSAIAVILNNLALVRFSNYCGSSYLFGGAQRDKSGHWDAILILS